MTGPPTPPPSSATEIEDAARTTAPLSQTATATEPQVVDPAQPPPHQPTPEPVQEIANERITSYQLLLPSIVELARAGSIRDLIQVAERGDLKADNDKELTRVCVVAPLVLAYMIVDEIPPARHVLKRLPENISSLPIMQALDKLQASVSERNYSNIYTRAEQLHQLVSDPAFPIPNLGQLLAGMTSGFVDAYRKKTFNLLARAYTSIPLPLAESYLGLTSEQVVNVAVPAGWDFHESTHILTPPKQASPSSRVPATASSTLMALTLVADSVANLGA